MTGDDVQPAAPLTHAERGRIGGLMSAAMATPQQRRERGVIGAMAAAVAVLEKRWDEMPPELRARVLNRIQAGTPPGAP